MRKCILFKNRSALIYVEIIRYTIKKASCVVQSPTAVKITVAQVNVKCKGSCTGSLTATGSGGSGTGYQYNWSTGASTACINNLCKGTYTVTVTDSKGCSSSISKTITEPAKVLAVTVTKTTCSVCLPNCNGTATVNPTGGTSPYTYAWSTGGTTKIITGLCAGTYTVTVTDKNGCTAICQTTIVGNCCNITLTPSGTDNNNCDPQCNGTLGVAAAGGSGSYKYLWSIGATTANINSLCEGSYTVTVTDASSATCFKSATYTVTDDITAPTPPEFNIGNTCSGSCNGYIAILGLEDLATSYTWSNGATTASIDDLCADTFTVIITYNNGCTSSDTIGIEEKSGPDLFPVYLNCHDSCNGGGHVLNDLDYNSFLWSNGQTTFNASNLCAGNYTVTVTDFSGCVLTSELELPNPEKIIATCSVISNETSPGAANGVLFVQATGGLNNHLFYGVEWSNGQFAPYDTLLTAGTYTATVTDEWGCQATTSCDILSCNNSRISSSSEVLNLSTIYPNPFSDGFVVKYSGDESYSVTITELSGRLIARYTDIYKEFGLGKDLLPGMYMVKIESVNGYQSSARIIKLK